MGCFWAPEGLLGGLPGAVATRVGLAGGDHPAPTYHAPRDHRETVELRYDPDEIDFPTLVSVFFARHNPAWTGVLTRFAAGLFVSGADEERVAREAARRVADERGITVRTPILSRGAFHPVGASHQKHYLRNERALMSELRSIYPRDDELVASRAAMRVNAVLSGCASTNVVTREIPSYGLSSESQRLLREILAGGRECEARG